MNEWRSRSAVSDRSSGDISACDGRVHGEFKITRRLEFGTNLDSGSATDTSRNLSVIQIRRPWVLAGVLPAPRESGENCSNFENR